MRKVVTVVAMGAALAALSGCGGRRSSGGIFGRGGPDEFQVARRAPLVIPPDYALAPPKPGAPRPQEADSSTQALQALFGGPARRSAAEAGMIGQAGRSTEPGIRSGAGDPGTTVVDKGGTTRDILAAPSGPGQDAATTTPK